MGRLAPRFAVVVAAWALAAPVRADFVAYTYSSTPAAPSIASDGGPGSTLNFTGETNVLAAGNTNVVLAGLTTTSNASPSSPATFTNKLWVVDLQITDTASGNSFDFLFGGRVTGQLSSLSSNFTNTFIGTQTLSEVIGSNLYTVTVGTFSPPGPPTASNKGSITAYVTVGPASGTIQGGATAPEPSTLILAGLGLTSVVAVRWRRRAAAV